MFKLSKKADYGLIAMMHLANHRESVTCSASEIAEGYGISTMLMAKVLQKLAKQGLVVAKHGASGGYQLAKGPERISALDVITAIDGPVLMANCAAVGELLLMSTLSGSPPPLGSIPLTVITAGKNQTPGWQEMQDELAASSNDSVHVVAEGAGHYVHHDDAEIIIEAVKDVVRRARQST